MNEKLFSLFWWGFTLLAIIGTGYVSVLGLAYKGHWLWVVADTGLIICSIKAKAWPMVFMFSIYLIMAICGLFVWKPN